MNKFTTVFLSLLFTVVLAPKVLGGNVLFELRGGYYFDTEEGFLGGGLVVPMAQEMSFNPNVERILVDNYDYFTVNGDFTYNFNAYEEAPNVWLGGGVAIIQTSWDYPSDCDSIFCRRNGSCDNTDVGLNLLGGIGTKTGSVRPFAQIKGRISDYEEVSLALGARF